MERLEKSQSIAEKKLVLLYILSILEDGVNNVALTQIILDGRYMDFFIMQQFLNELIEGEFVSKSEAPDSLYVITANGAVLLSGMVGLLPPAEKSRIDRTIGSIKKRLKDISAVSSDYIAYDEHRYAAKLKMEENGLCLLSVEVLTGSKDDARQICKNWEAHPQLLYTQIINLLTAENTLDQEAARLNRSEAE